MTAAQFEALATLLRMTSAEARRAAALVLVDGMSPGAAAVATGLSPQAVSNAVTRCRKGVSLARIAAGVDLSPYQSR